MRALGARRAWTVSPTRMVPVCLTICSEEMSGLSWCFLIPSSLRSTRYLRQTNVRYRMTGHHQSPTSTQASFAFKATPNSVSTPAVDSTAGATHFLSVTSGSFRVFTPVSGSTVVKTQRSQREKNSVSRSPMRTVAQKSSSNGAFVSTRTLGRKLRCETFAVGSEMRSFRLATDCSER